MDRFLKMFNHPILNREEIEIMNNPITSTEIEAVIKSCPPPPHPPKKEAQDDSFTGEFYQPFTEELMPIVLKFLQKLAEEGMLPNSFYEATITLILKPEKDNTQ